MKAKEKFMKPQTQRNIKPEPTKMKESETSKYPSPQYYLHPSDDPTAVISSNILTDDKESYWMWDKMLRSGLGAKNKVGFIDGTIRRPDDPEILNQYVGCNRMVMSWILKTIDPKLIPGIPYFDTAKELYDYIRRSFSFPRNLRIYQLLKEWRYVKQQQGESVTEYYNRFKRICDELDFYWEMPELGVEIITNEEKKKSRQREQALIFYFLMGLNYNFDTRRTQILLDEPLPCFNQVVDILRQEEARQKLNRRKISRAN